MTKFVFIWSKTEEGPVLPCGSDKVLMYIDGRWSRQTIHRKAREAILARARKDKTIAGYSVGCLSWSGDNWATCVEGFTPYTGEE